jgi:VWFA-related protein
LWGFSQDTIYLNIRDIDASRFAKVKFFLNILDKNGKPVTNIDSNSITVIEKGEKHIPNVENFFKSDKEGIAICVAIDASASMQGSPLENVKAGLLGILKDLRPQDKMGIAIFHDTLYRICDFTNDKGILKDVISGIKTPAASNTELYLSVLGCLTWLNQLEFPKRKVLIIISDGDDNGTRYKLENVTDSIKKAAASVYTIGSIEESFTSKGTLINMEKMAEASKNKGGKYYKIKTPDDIKPIIPAIYDRIKEEYVITDWSYESEKDSITGSIEVKHKGYTFVRDFSYKPKEMIENPPWNWEKIFKKPVFYIGAPGILLIIIVLGIFMFVNISKKNKYKIEKNEEARLREEERITNQGRYDQLLLQYNETLSQIEKQKDVSQSDKDKIIQLEKMIENAGKTMIGVQAKPIDYRRRTMILDSKTEIIADTVSKNPGLTIKNGFDTGKFFPINPAGTTIGRKDCNIILRDDTVSRTHAKIYILNGQIYIEDSGSRNGTFVNGKQITRSILNNGDIIHLGNTDIQVSS